MQYIDRGGEVEITGVSDLDLAKIFECGQCFRWEADDNGLYTGVAFGCVAKLRSIGDTVFISGSVEDFETLWRDYFDLSLDYAQLKENLCIDDFMRRATAYGAGIRILKQDKWEALCSFIISQNNNIPRIKKIIKVLCREYGELIEPGNAIKRGDGVDSGDDVKPGDSIKSANGVKVGDVFKNKEKQYYTFPSAATLAALDAENLDVLRCGYRADYIINAARAVSSGEIDLDALSRCSPEDARMVLKTLRGVGDKVADCVLLFGLNMLDAFPLDIWMKRAVAEHYGADFDPGIFSPYAGIAQQYIYYYTRSAVYC